jgi:hypothetical protein
MTVGKDVSLVLQTATGPLTISITEFSAKPLYTPLKSKPLSGETIYGKIPDGHELSFKLDRLSPAVDDYFAAEEAAYFAGQNQLSGTVYETIQEVSGITQYSYTGVIIMLENSGDYAGDKKVEQSIKGMATKKLKVS